MKKIENKKINVKIKKIINKTALTETIKTHKPRQVHRMSKYLVHILPGDREREREREREVGRYRYM